ncbi:Uma2 family endonuclease [Catenulispora sp. NL8]|uniref:Uma2 family endonuclease n=1 Tax=Catenulispora pinistramenti TaxID=2705254 RepID=A0ABS5KIY5_9ACTN|nr:Uma2 family endonuclease [Catenulispora pinistramenti]MBS2546342.1 Uma2 family endonuclease [Catenulispora pinistramenti]
MSIAFVEYPPLPDSPFAMWVSGELEDHLGLPEGFRVEIIEGDIVVSPAPRFAHNRIATRIANAFALAADMDPGFPWEAIVGTGVGEQESRGWIPDVAIVDKARSDEVAEAGLVIIGPNDMTMAVEVTSPSNADHDREPGPQHRQKNGNRIKTKWADYAAAGVEFYLLVDCDPRVSRAILYSEPNPSASRYEAAIAWDLGAPIVLPERFGLTVDTADWKAWS